MIAKIFWQQSVSIKPNPPSIFLAFSQKSKCLAEYFSNAPFLSVIPL
ncbi:MAG: hypothetical protein IKI11_00750 [Neisseriaceae bacterium]|nr:hypothetical protein [Neisseriaceae bacterium]